MFCALTPKACFLFPWPVVIFPASLRLTMMQHWEGDVGGMTGSSCRAFLTEQIPDHMTKFSLAASYFGLHFPFLENGDA